MDGIYICDLSILGGGDINKERGGRPVPPAGDAPIYINVEAYTLKKNQGFSP